MYIAVADQGGAAGTCPPQGSRFFRFDIQIFRNVAALGVGAPLRGWRSPMGNPGSVAALKPSKNDCPVQKSWFGLTGFKTYFEHCYGCEKHGI